MNNPFEEINERLDKFEGLLYKILESPNAQKSIVKNNIWFDVNELSEYLPGKPTKQTIYTWKMKNSIPFHKGSGKLRFSKTEIDAWLMEGAGKTLSQIENNAHKLFKRGCN